MFNIKVDHVCFRKKNEKIQSKNFMIFSILDPRFFYASP